jgi:S-adenosylmethionine:tRNA ribosyltransferase-isomerase
VETVYVTLHTGPGTFLPVKGELVRDHKMHGEYFEIGDEPASKINDAVARGARVLAVGTTVARVLESVANDHGNVRAGSGWTGLFIYPPYRFKVVKNLLTNFHLPCSTLIMLVSALAGREKLLELYESAKAEKYRFYSYGDAMLVMS